MLDVGLGLDQVDQRLGEGLQRGEHGFALGKVARVADRENHDRTGPCRCSGRKGAGGALVRMTMVVSSSGAPATQSR